MTKSWTVPVEEDGDDYVITLPPEILEETGWKEGCLLYTSPSPRDQRGYRMPSSA